VLFVLGAALLAVRKSRAPRRARLSLADSPDASAVTETQRHFGQEERR
jgi:hypothetical protein